MSLTKCMVITTLIAGVWGVKVHQLAVDLKFSQHNDHYMIFDTEPHKSPNFVKEQVILKTQSPPQSFSWWFPLGDCIRADRNMIEKKSKNVVPLEEKRNDEICITNNLRIEKVKNYGRTPFSVYNGVPEEPIMNFEKDGESELRWIPEKRFLLATNHLGAVLNEELYDFLVYPFLAAVKEGSNSMPTEYLYAETWQPSFREFILRVSNIGRTNHKSEAKYTMFRVDHGVTTNKSFSVGPRGQNGEMYARSITNKTQGKLRVIQTGIHEMNPENVLVGPYGSTRVLFDPSFPWVVVSNWGRISEKTYDCLVRIPLTKARQRRKTDNLQQPHISGSSRFQEDGTTNLNSPGKGSPSAISEFGKPTQDSSHQFEPVSQASSHP
ncbi:hypothetical protein PGT21_003310 [Puccinia graminis f. sp. tritici]|uniref:Uncharacterized protein n=1 Tax=Puccinia graminis f. sp. tritici TaxID=56615 RepID=A0A5B0Q1P8_PUCGR|nr:hypothetical protein PGT21_003310 [Puccinia graminis f. sp. tritici]KAA1137221.1 hypothetical protein PGTUg99_005732 [Puccinia graminis f. sp. tritici]